ncbi:MAG: FAD-dependent oxidoreductase, partial [Alphaproteobacteria bacterium]|nr:FAD-dependent oxidoreductase [Alphaproteobacteria bacterium]
MNLTTFARDERLRTQLARVLDLSGAAGRAAAPVVDLLVRLALAKAFFAPGMFPGIAAADFPTAWPMIIVQVIGPVLMAIGLLDRPIALLMLVLILRAQFSGAAQDEHLFWAALFGWYVVRGPASLSLDRLLSNGMRHSPLPWATLAIAAGDWVKRAIGPLYVLAIRLWLAAALAMPALPHSMLPAMQNGLLPSRLVVIGAVLLALGLCTPVVAAVLFVAGSGMAMAGSGDGMTIYEPLLLALLGATGAGRYSLDHLIGCWVRRPVRLYSDMPHVVIVGAGFGGMACAARLRHEPVRITLIDRENYHLFQPLLYQVATAALSPADITTPVRAAFRDNARMRVLRGTITAVDGVARQVIADGHAVAYDMLVLATGATHGYFGHEEWAVYAPGLKAIADATSIRSRILDAFEKAEATEDAALQRKLLTFLICGAGPTGVEMAGAIAELARNGMAKDFRNFDPASARILVVQAGPRVLPQFDERLSTFARGSLEALGVEVHTDSRVELIDGDGVVVNGERIAAGTVLWAAGVVASPASAWLGAEADRAGRIKVGPDLSVPGHSDIFAIGDTALSFAWGDQPVPGLAPAAKQGGAYVASVLRARLRGRKPPPPFRYRHQGSLATIGRRSAVADFGWVKVTGAAAWWLWGAVHILFLVGVRNRLSVMLGWVWS